MDDTEKAISTFAKGISILAAILTVVIIYSFFSEKILVKESTRQPFDQMFTVDSSAYISQIDIKAQSPQLLNNIQLNIYKSDKLVFSIDRNRSYSSKTMNKSTWHSNSDDSVTIYTKLDEGLHRASLKFIHPNIQKQKISVSIKEKVVRLKYLLPLFIMMIIMLLPTIRQKLIPKKQQKFIWWGLGGLAAVALFGLGAIVFIIVAYAIIQPILSGDSYGKDGYGSHSFGSGYDNDDDF